MKTGCREADFMKNHVRETGVRETVVRETGVKETGVREVLVSGRLMSIK